ncbi:MAG TPA: response regulator [Spirochaetota bacterium]|nr:response regulator [Spirochaetota bacterium]
MENSSATILVLDDEELVRANIVAFLEDEGFAVIPAESGEEALEILKSRPVDIGIIDMRLPGIDGNTFILQAHALNPRMRFMIHTGSINYTLPRELHEIGVRAGDVFRKPETSLTDMLGKIRTFLE